MPEIVGNPEIHTEYVDPGYGEGSKWGNIISEIGTTAVQLAAIFKGQPVTTQPAGGIAIGGTQLSPALLIFGVLLIGVVVVIVIKK
jgi:hypothetical protein